jgi:hypothetical protein
MLADDLNIEEGQLLESCEVLIVWTVFTSELGF